MIYRLLCDPRWNNILRTCVILGWDYYTVILRQDLHPTTRPASYDKTCTQQVDKAQKLKFKAQKLKFKTHKLKFKAHKLKFKAQELKFKAHKLKFKAQKLKFKAQKLMFKAQKLKFNGPNMNSH